MAAVDLEYNKGFQIYNSDGTLFHDLVLHKCTYETVVMSLGDKISGILYYKDNALDVKMTEYIIYKGVKYTLVNPPTILKEGLVSDNGELKGMTKYSFTFYHPMYVLNNFSFNDVAVSSDQNKYLSQNKTFSWIGNLNDYVAKINKNLQGTEWFVKVGDNVTQEEKTKLSDVLSFDKNTIAEALKRGYETWEVPYIVDSIHPNEYLYVDEHNVQRDYYDDDKHFVVLFGLPTTEITVKDDNDFETPYVFKMGQGVGLKNNSRNPKNNKIITRIAGYGSEDNIPYGYPQIRYYGGTVQYPLYYGIVGGQRVQLIKHPFTRNHLMPSVYSQAVYNKVNPKLSDGSNNPNYNPDIELVDYYDADSTYANPIKSGSPSYEIHEFGDIKPELGEEAIINAVPVNAQETQSDYKQKSNFLQEILNRISSTDIDDEKVCLKTLYDKVDAGLSYYAQKGEEGGSEYWYRISVTSDEYYQYVSYESGNYNFTATVLKNDSSAPTPEWDDTMDDDGKYLQSYFKITLPILSFDLYACAAITQEMKINMRSGACIGCTFPVQVDWDDYKRNFYNSDGEFAPDGEQRDYTKYPDSRSGQITVMVKKELETFGTLMPNQYQQPTTGDKFVILGISLPESYITNAEQRLDADMKQYMRDNNVYYYEYPLKFDEHFLISNENILSQMKPNVVVRFEYAGKTHALYIKQMSVKYNESPLPKYDITLTDDIEIVLNQIGQVTDEVSKLRLGLGENGIGGNGQEYLRKDIDDTARGTIRMVKGMQVGERFVTGLLGEGGVFRKDVDGTTYLETDKLYVRMKAYFDTVEVKHYLHTGGNRIASQASGIVCSRVEYINNNDDVTTDLGEAVLFRCYFKANDGDKTIRNDFMIGDLAFCRETNVDVSSVNLHGYWRLIIGRNSNGSLTENKEGWIDLSNRANETLTIDGKDYVCNGYQNGSDAPIAQDDIIQLGNIANTDRQGAIVEYVGGEDAPSYQIFQGIGSDLPYPYTLEDKNYIGLGYSSQTGHAYMNVYGDFFFGAKPDSVTDESPTYIKYVQEDSEGKPKLSIKAEVEFIHSDGQGGSTSTTMDDFVKSIEDSFKDIQDQIDGEIDTWYYEGVPDLTKLPASEWNTDELKREHIGDLYYDKENGDAYRFIFDTSVEPNEYKWIQLHDDALAEALRLAADAKETADNKRRVFLSQPTPPYDEGDLWVNATYPANSDSTDAEHNRYYNDVLCAKKAVPRTEDGQEITAFSINDWVLASKYTDDTKFDGYINQILNGTGASGYSAIVANAIRAIKGALNEATIIDGGLVLTSLINLRSNNKTWAGISGQYDATAKGYGIASWYGGGMADWEVYKETHPSATIDDTYAKSLFRFDGSGYLAGGNITWDDQGRVAIKDITTLVGGNNTDILNALTTFNSAFHFNTQQGETTVLSIVPQAGFTSLNITENGALKPVATQEWVGQNYISVAFFNRLFRAYNGETLVNANDTKSTIDNIKAMFGFWTEKYISALGKGDDGGSGTILNEPLMSINAAFASNPTASQTGYAIVWNGSRWTYGKAASDGIDFNDMKLLTVKVGTNTTPVIEYKGETAKTLTFDAVANSGITVSGDTGGTITIGYTLPTASANTLGGVKVGNTLSISDGVLNLPTISNLVAGTYRSVTVDAYGRVTAGTNPTTLAGYGITDAVSNSTKWWGQSIQTINNAKVVKGDMTDVDNITMTGSINMPRLGDGIKFLVGSSYIPALRMFQNSDIVALGYETFQSGFGTNIYGNEVYIQHGIYDGANYFTSFRSNGHVTINAQDDTDASRNIFLNVGGSTKTSRLYLSNDIYLVVENGGVHVVGGGLYADTFVSALGKGDDGGASTFDEAAMWNALGTAGAAHKIDNSHLNLGTLTISNGTTMLGTWTPTANGTITISAGAGDRLAQYALSDGASVGSFTHTSDLIYTAKGGQNGCTDKPDGVDAFGVLSFKTAVGYYGQVLIPAGIGRLYVRSSNSLDGTAWNEVALTSDLSAYTKTTSMKSLTIKGGTTDAVVYNPTDASAKTVTIKAGTGMTVTGAASEITITRNNLSASDIPNLDWSKITTGKPTTLSDYGITDAVSSATKWWGRSIGTDGNVKGDMTDVYSITMSGNVRMNRGQFVQMNINGDYRNVLGVDQSNAILSLGYRTAEQGIDTRIFGTSVKLWYYDTTWREGLTLDNSGNVGIGTTNPSYRLDVSGDTHVSGDLRVGNERFGWNAVDGRDVFFGYSWNGDANTYRDMVFGTYVDAIQYGGLYFNGSSWSWGIGFSEPKTKLDVNGSIKASRFYFYKPNADNDTDAVYIEYVSSGSGKGVHLVGDGFYSDSFVSALGKGDDGGTSTFDESQMWTALGGSISNKQIDSSHLSTALASYATQQWVTNQLGNISNYVTTNTNQTITGQKTFNGSYMQPLVVDSSNTNDNRTAIQFKHTVNGTSVFYGGISMSSEGGSFQRYDQNYTRYTIWDSGNDGSGSGLDADLLDGKHASEFALASNLSNYLPLSGGTVTSALHQPMILRTTSDADYNWIGLSFRKYIGGTETMFGGIRMDSQNSYLKRYDSTYNVYTILDSGNSSVTLSGETLTVKINGTSKSLTNTWRGIQDNLTSTSTTDSLSANQGRLLKNDVTTLQGYFSNGVAKSAAKLSDTASYTAWGRTFFTNGKPSSVSGALDSVTDITMSGDIKMQQGHYITAYIDDAYYNVLGAWGGSLKIIQLCYNTSLSKQYATNIYGNTLRLYGSSTSLGILINTSGNVGIGTSSPSVKLDVQGSVKIGGATLTWDSTNQALKIDKGLYSESFVSALGANASGGSGSGIDANWLKTNDVEIKRLGIGVAPSSSYQLNVQGASNFTGAVAIRSMLTVNSSVSAVGGFSTSQGSISAAHNITAGGDGLIHGRLTVGQTSVNNDYQLYVSGNAYVSNGIYLQSNVYIRQYSPASGVSLCNIVAPSGLSVNGSTSWSSDMRKKDVVSYVNDLDVNKVAKAPVFRFTWKDKRDSVVRVGTSAQYWREIMPSTVMDMGEYGLTLDYNAITIASAVITARKVVDHELRIKQLEQENAILREEIKSLKAA